MHDLIIRGGTIVDGTGCQPFIGDVAITDRTILGVGQVEGKGACEIDARGLTVTPGFVDIHTHYDGHATWTDRLYPSSHHGVTTVVMGNCGVGFAPCKAADRDRLVRLMEGVEDIPEVVMTAGLPWNWESFPEYLDRLEERRFDMDIATQVPHAALRVYVMGERAAAREPATAKDIAKMRKLAREGIEAGALGFSTSRFLNHKSTDGSLIPTYGSASDELAGIAGALAEAGTGVLQLVSDWDDPDGEIAIMKRMMRESGRPMSTTVMQVHAVPGRWREILDRIEQATAEGFPLKGQVSGRPIGVMMGLQLTRNPFMYMPPIQELAHLSHGDRLAKLRDPQRRKRILTATPGKTSWVETMFLTNFAEMYEFDGSNYLPTPDQSIAKRAQAANVEPAELAYDILTHGNGDAVIYIPGGNYFENRIEPLEQMLLHKDTVWALGDGGAHCSLLCDASLTTYYLEHWTTMKGGPLPVEKVVKAMTWETASAVGLGDRGLIASGYRADINLIDMQEVKVGRPEIIADLPTGAVRLNQCAKGYRYTILAGEVTYRDGEPSGALPGRLVRGAQEAGSGRRTRGRTQHTAQASVAII